METIEVKTKNALYNVYVGSGVRHNLSKLLPKPYRTLLIVTDSEVAKYSYLDDIKNSLKDNCIVFEMIIPSGEQSKSLEQFEAIHTLAIECGLDRQSALIALGGGMVGDITGFVAATYMRGIDYIQIPTTILAHDSSVGGKVAVNHTLGKNLIGSFHQPRAVIYDLDTLSSLPQKEIRSGFAEIIKHAILADKNLLQKLMGEIKNLQTIDRSILHHSIVRGIEIKANIVEMDERENGVRSYLNLGHTLGHAIEACAGYGKITHGEAVAVGILFAAKLSQQIFGLYSLPPDFRHWLKTLKYPIQFIENLDVERLIDIMKVDKKNADGNIRMVLLEAIEKPKLVSVKEEDIITALHEFQKEVI